MTSLAVTNISRLFHKFYKIKRHYALYILSCNLGCNCSLDWTTEVNNFLFWATLYVCF